MLLMWMGMTLPVVSISRSRRVENVKFAGGPRVKTAVPFPEVKGALGLKPNDGTRGITMATITAVLGKENTLDSRLEAQIRWITQ
jgi:hypothetical protein